MSGLRVFAAVVALTSIPSASDGQPKPPEATKPEAAKPARHSEAAAVLIPTGKLPPFDRDKKRWRCTVTGSDGYRLTYTKGKDPTLQPVSEQEGERIDVWVDNGVLWVLDALSAPTQYTVVSTDEDLLVAVVSLSDAVRGAQTFALDYQTGFLHETRSMMWVKERKTSNESSVYVCR